MLRPDLLTRFMAHLWSDAETAYRRRILAGLPHDASLQLLDVGCEDGAWTDELRRAIGIAPDHVHGLEIVPDFVERARSRGFDVRSADLEEAWPFGERMFDFVHANQVIEHVRDLDHFVTELKRVLKPGGSVVVCTENLASWHNVFALVLGFQPFSLTHVSRRGSIGNPLALHIGESSPGHSFQHVYVLSLTALRALFMAHGFVVESAWGEGYHPFPGRVGSGLARIDPRHSHFIGITALRPLESTR